VGSFLEYVTICEYRHSTIGSKITLVGGVGELSYGCSGGRKEHRCQCFDLRLMWRLLISHFIEFTYLLYFRADSVAELYTYLPLTPENAKCLKSVPPRSIENSDYGFSVGRGAFHLDVAVGQWVAVALRIKLNNIGSTNGCFYFVIVERGLLLTLTCKGQIQLWINGNSVIDLDGVTLRDAAEAGRIKGMHFQTFFGGMLLNASFTQH
jgi:hypothetical protein